MRPTRHITAVVLLTALAVVGCSKRDETPLTKAESADVTPVKPVATSGDSAAGKHAGDEGTPANVTAPVTFADGKAAYAAGKYGDATTIFEGYSARRPGNAWGHYMLGLSAWKSGDLAKAEGAFGKALRADPHHVKSFVNLSRVLIAQKRHRDAGDRLTQAAALVPDSPEVHRLLGRVYAAQGKTDEAMAAYRRAIELNELDAWSMNNLGLLWLEKKHAGEALPLFARAAELRNEVPAFHNNLGMALEHTGRFRDAALAYSSALCADPTYDKAKQNLARVEAIKVNGEEKTSK